MENGTRIYSIVAQNRTCVSLFFPSGIQILRKNEYILYFICSSSKKPEDFPSDGSY